MTDGRLMDDFPDMDEVPQGGVERAFANPNSLLAFSPISTMFSTLFIKPLSKQDWKLKYSPFIIIIKNEASCNC